MLVGYARCSTDAQDLTAQHTALTTFGVKGESDLCRPRLLARQRRAATLDLTTVLTTTVTTVAVPATPPTRPFAADLAWLLSLPAPGSVGVRGSSPLSSTLETRSDQRRSGFYLLAGSSRRTPCVLNLS
jgi:hypothetical protein